MWLSATLQWGLMVIISSSQNIVLTRDFRIYLNIIGAYLE